MNAPLKITKIGNSAGVILPKRAAFLRALSAMHLVGRGGAVGGDEVPGELETQRSLASPGPSNADILAALRAFVAKGDG